MKTEVLTHARHHAAKHAGNEETETLFAGKTAVTILLAIGFLGLVMFLSYVFISGTR